MAKIPIIGWIEKKIKRMLAIVQDTDIATQAIAKGKYVIWHDELYTASSAIAEGTTLATGAGGNLTVVSDGGLNELNSNITTLKTGEWVDFTQAASAGITFNIDIYTTNGYIIRGGMCFVNASVNLANAQGDTSLAVFSGLPTSLKNTIKPPSWSSYSMNKNEAAESLFQDGVLYIRNAQRAGNWALSFCYPVSNP